MVSYFIDELLNSDQLKFGTDQICAKFTLEIFPY